MRLAKPLILPFAAIGLLAGCASQPEVRKFDIRVDDGFYTVTENRRGPSLFGAGPSVARSVRVAGSNVPCPALPCTRAVRTALGTQAQSLDEARLPQPGVDLGLE
ncbi:MAG: hypothetical protein RIG84_19855 [Roseovarius sp.]